LRKLVVESLRSIGIQALNRAAASLTSPVVSDPAGSRPQDHPLGRDHRGLRVGAELAEGVGPPIASGDRVERPRRRATARRRPARRAIPGRRVPSIHVSVVDQRGKPFVRENRFRGGGRPASGAAPAGRGLEMPQAFAERPGRGRGPREKRTRSDGARSIVIFHAEELVPPPPGLPWRRVVLETKAGKDDGRSHNRTTSKVLWDMGL